MIDLEQLADGSVSDRNFQKLRALVPDTGGQSVGLRFGTATLTFTASQDSASETVAHGLGRAPVVVLALSKSAPATDKYPLCNWGNEDDTSFDISGRIEASHTGDINVTWIAIG